MDSCTEVRAPLIMGDAALVIMGGAALAATSRTDRAMTHLLSFRFPFAALVVALAVSGCSLWAEKETEAGKTEPGKTEPAKPESAKKQAAPAPLTCPHVTIDRATSTLTRFRDGPGRDITDIDLEAEILGYTGDCGRTKAGVDVMVAVSFSATRGPAAKGRSADVPYFVALSRLSSPLLEEKIDSETGEKTMVRKTGPEGDASWEREILSKQVFQISSLFPEGSNVIHFRDEEIVLELPLAAGESPRNYTVHLGFQLTREQIEYNRQQQPH